MPTFSQSLEKALHQALTIANERHHEYATLEHLLLALIDDQDAAAVMSACNVNLDELFAFHKNQKGMVTLTAVRPPARFGALEFDGNLIRHFKEKSTLHEGWINGGFFVIEPEAMNYIDKDVMWEHDPMERLAAEGHLYAYQHNGFWQCMDTARDLQYLESLWSAGNAPWKSW